MTFSSKLKFITFVEFFRWDYVLYQITRSYNHIITKKIIKQKYEKMKKNTKKRYKEKKNKKIKKIQKKDTKERHGRKTKKKDINVRHKKNI